MLGDYKGDDYNMVINSLKLMFPTHSECNLQQVVKDSVDLKDAADMILSDDKGNFNSRRTRVSMMLSTIDNYSLFISISFFLAKESIHSKTENYIVPNIYIPV